MTWLGVWGDGLPSPGGHKGRPYDAEAEHDPRIL
jgi:hypothetical protein